MMSTRTICWLLLLAVLGTAIPSVGRLDDLADGVVADVGGEPITAAAFRHEIEASQQADASLGTAAARRQILDQVVERRLLVLGAFRDLPGAAMLSDSVRRYQIYHQVWNTVRRDLEPDPAELTPEFLDALREARKNRWIGRHIVLDTEDDARAALRRIEAGEAFKDVAEELSRDISTRAAGGRFHPFRKSDWYPVLEELFAGLDPGEIGGPVRTRLGYHVVMLDSVVVAPEPEDLLADDRLIELVKRSVAIGREDEWVQKFAVDHGLAVVSSAVDTVLEYLRPRGILYPMVDRRWTPTDDPIAVSAEGDTLTVSEFLQYFPSLGMESWPQPRNRHSLVTSVTRVMAAHVFARRYREGEFQLDAEAELSIQTRVEQALAARMRREKTDPGEVDSLRLAEVFASHPDEFLWPESAQIAAILTRKRDVADQVMEWLRAGISFDEAGTRAQAMDPDLTYTPSTPLFPRGSFAETDSLIFSMEPGEFSDLYITGGGKHFSVFKLIRKQPPRQMRITELSDEQLTERVEHILHEELESDLLRRLRSEFPVRLDEEQINAIVES